MIQYVTLAPKGAGAFLIYDQGFTKKQNNFISSNLLLP